MSLADIIKNDLQQIELELDYPMITYRDESIRCVPSGVGVNDVLEIGGFSVTADISFVVRKEVFADGIYPQSQEKVTSKGITYRIATVREDTTGVFLRLICINENRGI